LAVSDFRARSGGCQAIWSVRPKGVVGPLGLTFETFSIIVTLRRSGRPFALNPTTICRDSLLSSGAVTNRIDSAEAQGLVKRRPDPSDRRGAIVS
jgi:DNA-binding MarR family transcriptional regulator